MHRTHAIALLGGNVSCAALHLGVSYQAVYKWPERLPEDTVARITQALAWMHCEKQLAALGLQRPDFIRAPARHAQLRDP